MSAVAYTPRDPTASVLYTVVREHVETFRVEAVRLRDGRGLPRFVDAEFDAFLRCGFLAASAPTPPVCHARWEGLNLHAGVRIQLATATVSNRFAATRFGRPWPVTTCT